MIVECKNYGREVANSELDQLAGRFGSRRGNFGMLLCRSFKEKDRFLARCRDTAIDGRGYIVPLDDGDLKALVDDAKSSRTPIFGLLRERFDSLIG